jgi:hypothetical protein
MKLDTDLDLARLNAKQADNIKELPTASASAMPFPTSNTDTDTPSLLPAPSSNSPDDPPYALLGIDSLPHLHSQTYHHHSALLKTLFLDPLLWLSICGIIFFAHRLYRDYVFRRLRNLDRQQRMRGRGRREREGKRALRDEEEARWEVFEAFGMLWGWEEGFAEQVLLESGGMYVDPGCEVFGIVGLEMSIPVAHESVLILDMLMLDISILDMKSLGLWI